MIIFSEMKKLIRQMLGKQNIFGYKTTLANRLYLLFCVMSKIYYTDKIHQQVKYIWAAYHVFGMTIAYIMCMSFLIFDRERNILMMLYATHTLAMCNLLTILLPLITYFYRNDIESTISSIDKTLTKKYSSGRTKTKPQNNLKSAIISCAVFSISAYSMAFINLLDIALLYDDDKVKNNAYYAVPLPNIHTIGSMRLLLFSNATFAMVYVPMCFETMAIVMVTISWNIVCANRLVSISEQLEDTSNMLRAHVENTYQTSASWRKIFLKRLRSNMVQFEEVIELIQQYRKFFELFCSVMTTTGVIIEVVYVFALMSEMNNDHTSLTLIIRSFLICAYTAWVLFTYCNVAEILETSVSRVSFALYSMPWYWDVGVRKEVLMFLLRTQQNVNLSIAKVYPFRLCTYSRLANTVWSIVHCIRRMTRG